MTHFRTRPALAALSLTLLAGCSGPLLQPAGPKYETAASVQNLEVPPDLTAPELDSQYAVPGRAGRVSAVDVGLQEAGRPTAGQEPVLPDFEGLRMREEAGVRWIEVDASAEQLWPRLRDFWRSQGLALKRDEPVIGLMETEWAENRADIPMGPVRQVLGRALSRFYDAGMRDQFRIRVAREGEAATAVYLTHRGAEEAIDSGGAVKWQMRPTDPELEAEMLRRLVVFLGRSEEESRRMMSADGSAQAAPARVEIIRQDGVPALRVTETPQRVWRRLGLALDRASLLVDDQDRDGGIYHVTAVEETRAGTEGEGGFLSRIFGGRRDSLRDDARYEVHVAAQDEHTLITVHGAEGRAAKAGEVEAVLKRIEAELY